MIQREIRRLYKARAVKVIGKELGSSYIAAHSGGSSTMEMLALGHLDNHYLLYNCTVYVINGIVLYAADALGEIFTMY